MTMTQRAFAGTGLGILFGVLTIPATVQVFLPAGPKVNVVALVLILILGLPVIAILTGPAAFLMSCIHAARMVPVARRARSLAEIRVTSVLLGLPLGVAALLLTIGIGAFVSGEDLRKLILTPEIAAWMIPAAAGGAGIGLGVTTGLRPGNAPPPPPRPLHTRVGAPFFDNRLRRAA